MVPRCPVKVLIFSVSIGAGHDSVAQALAERLLIERPGSVVKIVDTFQYINSVLNKVVLGSYMETLKFTPKVWGYLYDQAEDGERLIDLGQILSKVLSPKLEQLLREVNPDYIITTHAFPTGMMSVLKRQRIINVPVCAVVTDYHVHSFWVHDYIDHFFLPAPDLAYPLLKTGIARGKIHGTGIPIRDQFSEKIEQEQARKELSITSGHTILVMGGGLGLGKIEVITRELLENWDYQVIVVAGKNKRLEGELLELHNGRLKVLGYVENMAKVMTAADIIISKPGGVTTAEVLALSKPLVIFASLPGQEDRNTDYLLNKGAAIKVKKIDMLIPEIMALWRNPLRLRHMTEIAQQLSSPKSSQLFWDTVYSSEVCADAQCT